jgi:taurine dioxygenase
LKDILDGLHVVNTSSLADVSKTREDRIATDGRAEAKKEYVAEHPAVLVHPETGRKALNVNVAHSSHFRGMTEAESRPILQYLFQHQVRPEFTCRFVWQLGSLAFWDNRCTQHNPVNDYHGFKRVMHRITLAAA